MRRGPRIRSLAFHNIDTVVMGGYFSDVIALREK
jgi:hypothetical protein